MDDGAADRDTVRPWVATHAFVRGKERTHPRRTPGTQAVIDAWNSTVSHRPDPSTPPPAFGSPLDGTRGLASAVFGRRGPDAPPVADPVPVASVDATPTARPTIIVMANQKGGVAKTTTTLNLAVALAEKGHRVLAIDLDPQGNLTMSQGLDPDVVMPSMYHVLVEGRPIADVTHAAEIDVAAASIDLASAEVAMASMIGRERALERALRAVASRYDYVCIDTPPSLGLLTINALTAADQVIVPVQAEYLSLRGLAQLRQTVDMVREHLNPRLRIQGILPTLLDTRTVHAQEALELLEEHFGDQLFVTRVRKTIRFAEAPVRGMSVLRYDPDSRAAQAYRDLAQEVLRP